MQSLPLKNETPTSVFNPSLEDFSVNLSDDDNVVHTYVLPAGQIATLPYYIASHAADKLADKLVWEKGIKLNPQLDKENALKEILV